MDVVIFLVYVATKRVELRRCSVAALARKRVNCFFKFKCVRLRSDAASLRKRRHLNLKKLLTRFLAEAAKECRGNSTRFVATYTRKITTSIFLNGPVINSDLLTLKSLPAIEQGKSPSQRVAYLIVM